MDLTDGYAIKRAHISKLLSDDDDDGDKNITESSKLLNVVDNNSGDKEIRTFLNKNGSFVTNTKTYKLHNDNQIAKFNSEEAKTQSEATNVRENINESLSRRPRQGILKSSYRDSNGSTIPTTGTKKAPPLGKCGVSITISPPTPAEPKRQRSEEYSPPDFDYMFKNPTGWFRYGVGGDSLDEGVYSFDEGTSRLTPEVFDTIRSNKSQSSLSAATMSPNLERRMTRIDSVMSLRFSEMLTKNVEHSQGFCGFRRRMATQISHKYCSYCRCDDMIFIFLYVVFGIAYLCLGVFGLTQCNHEQFINYFLICDGVLSVFVFPITIMEWSSRIGGCVTEEEKQTLGNGIYFVGILLFRLGAAVCGTYLVVTRFDIFQSDNAVCITIFSLLQAGVCLEWAFMILAVVLPFIVYGVMYSCAKRSSNLDIEQEGNEDNQTVRQDSIDSQGVLPEDKNSEVYVKKETKTADQQTD